MGGFSGRSSEYTAICSEAFSPSVIITRFPLTLTEESDHREQQCSWIFAVQVDCSDRIRESYSLICPKISLFVARSRPSISLAE